MLVCRLLSLFKTAPSVVVFGIFGVSYGSLDTSRR